jgi:hypothetical protein
MNKESELIILKPGRQSDPDFELISRHWNDNGVFCFAVFPRVSGAAFTTLHFLRILQMAQQANISSGWKACQGQTLWLIGPILKLRRKKCCEYGT